MANIKAVKVYQAVEFEGKLSTYFVEVVKDNRMVGLKMSLWEGVGVKLATAKDSIVVPFANIAYIKDEMSEADKKHPSREPKSGEQKPNRLAN